MSDNATERLRELLDERGVKYDKEATVIGGTVATFWHDRDGYPCSAIEGADDIPDGEVSVQVCVTPEQATRRLVGGGPTFARIVDNLALLKLSSEASFVLCSASRAARTLVDSCNDDYDYGCGGCPVARANCKCGDYDALLEWLRG